MNNQRRTIIRRICRDLRSLQSEVGNLVSAEETAFDNSPESIQDGDKGEAMQEAISNLEDASSSIDEVIDSLEEALA